MSSKQVRWRIYKIRTKRTARPLFYTEAAARKYVHDYNKKYPHSKVAVQKVFVVPETGFYF